MAEVFVNQPSAAKRTVAKIPLRGSALPSVEHPTTAPTPRGSRSEINRRPEPQQPCSFIKPNGLSLAAHALSSPTTQHRRWDKTWGRQATGEAASRDCDVGGRAHLALLIWPALAPCLPAPNKTLRSPADRRRSGRPGEEHRTSARDIRIFASGSLAARMAWHGPAPQARDGAGGPGVRRRARADRVDQARLATVDFASRTDREPRRPRGARHWPFRHLCACRRGRQSQNAIDRQVFGSSARTGASREPAASSDAARCGRTPSDRLCP